MMYPSRSVICNQCVTVGGMLMGEALCGGRAVYGKSLPSSRFCGEPEIVPKCLCVFFNFHSVLLLPL